MKKTLYGVLAGILLTLATSCSTVAQPPWHHDYHKHNHRGFVYFPEYDFYYDIPRGGYFYFDNGEWRFAISLPMHFVHLDLRRARKVHCDVFCDYPWHYNKWHRRGIWGMHHFNHGDLHHHKHHGDNHHGGKHYNKHDKHDKWNESSHRQKKNLNSGHKNKKRR